MLRSLARLAWLCALTPACVLDFDQFRIPRAADVSEERDVAVDAALDVGRDVTPDVRTDVAVDSPACTPGRSSTGSFRLAHMASGIGAVDLCMRRRTGTEAFQRVTASSWPGSVGYGQVSATMPFNAAITRANDAWEFAVVSSGTPCSQATSAAVTLRSVQLDPGVMRMLVLTTERSPDGGVVGVLNVLSDEGCTDCQSRQVDVRAVHALSSTASQRLSVSLDPVIDPRLLGSDLASMRVFAASVSYGSASDYACNALWGAFTVAVLSAFQVQLSAQTATGAVIARSDLTRLKPSLLQQTRVVTVFLEGGVDDVQSFVVCYDGLGAAGYSTCDRVAAHMLGADAGVDAAGSDSSAVDASDDLASDDVFPDAAADDDLPDASDDVPVDGSEVTVDDASDEVTIDASDDAAADVEDASVQIDPLDSGAGP